MKDRQNEVARQCLAGAEQDTLTFPEIVEMLAGANFDGYLIDFRRDVGIYYPRDGGAIEAPTHKSSTPVAPDLDVEAMRAAIADARALAPGYTYIGFCDRVRAAGCAGYLVSLAGRRAVYFGRTAELHVERFPDSE